MAKPTEVDDGLFGDSDGDICFGDGAGMTDVSDGGNELDTAHGAEYGDISMALDFHLREKVWTKI